MEAPPKYNCPRCRYATNNRKHFVRHLHNKTPCMVLYQDVPIPDIISSLNPEKEFKCPHCTKSFAHLPNLSRHKKTHNETEVAPPVVNNTNNVVDSHDTNTNNTNIIDSHDTIDNSHNNSHNNVTIENLHITVNLLPFGREDCSRIQNDTELLNKYITEGIAQAIPEIVNAIFLNDDLPQNKNVKLGRDHYPPEMLVYKNNVQTGEPGWESKPRADVLQKLVDKGANVLMEHNNNLFHSAEKTDEVRELHDWRSNKLSDIKNQKRGTATVKDAVLLKFKENKKSAENAAS